MAVRAQPVLPLPAGPVGQAIHAAMTAAHPPLQHQDELTAFLTWLFEQPTFQFPLGVVVEIGTHRGAMLDLWGRLALRVIGIDLPEGVGGGLTADHMARRFRDLADRHNFVGIMGDSHDRRTRQSLSDALVGRAIDLLFIDGDHTYAGVEADWHDYSPFVRSGGVVAFHDVTCSPQRCLDDRVAVPQFWATLPEPKHVFSVGYEWGGIGAIIMP